MRTRRRVWMLVVGALFLAPLSVVAAQSLQTYESKLGGVRITYPNDWIKSETLPGVLVAFGAPKDKANLKLVENISVVVQDLSPDIATLAKYSKMYEEQRKKDPLGVKVVESKKTTLAGLPAQQIVCTAKQGGLEVKFLQIWTVKKNKAYLMTYGATVDTYKNFVDEAKDIIASLKFI